MEVSKDAGVYAGRGAKGSALRGKLMILTGSKSSGVPGRFRGAGVPGSVPN